MKLKNTSKTSAERGREKANETKHRKKKSTKQNNQLSCLANIIESLSYD
jgi:hypothetical protein